MTLEKLEDILYYDFKTGEWWWKERFDVPKEWNTRWAHKKAGGINSLGYHQICIDGVIYLAHVLAWFYMTGTWPENEIDHRNETRNDNRWCNLRKATKSQNMCNRGKQRNNKSGIKGVCWSSRDKKWIVTLNVNRKCVFRQTFNIFEDAVLAREKASIQFHKEFAKL